MKRTLLAVVSALTLAVPFANAADMAVPEPAYKAPPPPGPMWSWTGIYIGANIGAGWTFTDWFHNHNSTCPGNGAFTVSSCDIGSQSSNSFIGGGQIGARVQTGQFVFGIEGTADYANFHKSTPDPVALATGFAQLDDTRLRGLYTATGQAGFAWDRELWYVKGGWAGSWLTQTANDLSGPTFGTVAHAANGWTVGTGIEISPVSIPNFSMGLEYDFMRLSASDTSTCTTGVASVFSCGVAGTVPLQFTNFHADVNELVVRANYRFNWWETR